jgi:hypothetical protein
VRFQATNAKTTASGNVCALMFIKVDYSINNSVVTPPRPESVSTAITALKKPNI